MASMSSGNVCMELQLDMGSGEVLDQYSIPNDFIHLANNSGANLYDDLLAICAVCASIQFPLAFQPLLDHAVLRHVYSFVKANGQTFWHISGFMSACIIKNVGNTDAFSTVADVCSCSEPASWPTATKQQGRSEGPSTGCSAARRSLTSERDDRCRQWSTEAHQLSI